MLDRNKKSERELGSNNSRGEAFNVAHVDSALEEGIASIAPAGAPGVANNPVVLSAEGSVTDKVDCVVDLLSGAGRIRVDSGPV